MRLSIIIPAHNEEATIQQVLDKVFEVDLSSWEKEVIVVNDGSSDRTKVILDSVSPKVSGPFDYTQGRLERSRDGGRLKVGILDFVVFHHKENLGKGGAIQTALERATGDYVIIQDADAEYDPGDIPNLLSSLGDLTLTLSSPGEEAAIFGARGYKAYPERGFHYVIGAWLLTNFYNLLYHECLTDLYTGYKLILTSIFKELDIQSTGFEFEAEVACKLAKRGVIIKEIPIRYTPRNKDQGKHIRFKDAVKGFWMIIKCRVK